MKKSLITTNAKRRLLGAFALALLATAPWAPLSAAEQTVTAFSIWQVSGPVVQTGENHATFTGVFDGPVYIETERGPVLAGAIVCPAIVEIELQSGRQSATAHCAFHAGDGGRIFALLTCQGVHLVGCDGDFAITGGSGRFAGIAGSSKVTVRGDFHTITVSPDGPAEQTAEGIIHWPELHYTLP